MLLLFACLLPRRIPNPVPVLPDFSSFFRGSIDDTQSSSPILLIKPSHSSSYHHDYDGVGFLRLIHLNCRSLKTALKFEILSNHCSNDYDIVCCSETWFTDAIASTHSLINFSHFYSCRSAPSHGGGVSVFIRNGIDVLSVSYHLLAEEHVQVICLDVSFLNLSFTLIVVYSSNYLHASSLSEFLLGYVDVSKTYLLTGDLNVDLRSDTSGVSDFVGKMGDLNLLPLHKLITRPASSTCLDHFWVSNDGVLLIKDVRIINSLELSDHYPISLFLSAPSSPSFQAVSPGDTCRIFSKSNYSRFHSLLRSMDWSGLFGCSTVDQAFEVFSISLGCAYQHSFPLVPTLARSRPSPWYSERLRRLASKLNTLGYRYFRLGCLGYKAKFYQCRSSYRRQVRIARFRHTRRSINAFRNSPKRLWRFINSSCGRTRSSVSLPSSLSSPSGLQTDTVDILNAFADHFAVIGQRTASTVQNVGPDCSPLEFLPSSGSRCFSLRFIDPQILTLLVPKMDTSYKGAVKNVPDKVIRSSIALLAVPIAFLFNLSLATSTFPSSFKSSSITPLYKCKGSKSDPNSYRPISLIPFLSKLFERCIKDQLEAYLESFSYFSPSQHGFLSGRSTDTALCEIAEFARQGSASGNVVVGVFLDVAKAFDCVSHPVLLNILSRLGVDQRSINWLSSFLSDRTITVRAGGMSSSARLVNIGLAQGSVLGPFLFIVYLNVILLAANAMSTDLRLVSYADDTSILFRLGKDSRDCGVDTLNSHLNLILSYFDFLRLSINVNKTQVIAFRDRRTLLPAELQNIRMRGSQVTLVPSVICLGIILDSNFGWTSHIKLLRGRLLSVIAIIHRLRRVGLPTNILLSVVRSLFEPLLSYGIVLWGSSPSSTLRPLEVCQNNAFRAVFGLNYRVSVRHLYDQHKLLPLNKLYILKMSALSFRSVHGMLSPFLSTRFVVASSPIRNDRHLNIQVRPAFTNYLAASPVNQVIAVWNSLPTSLKGISDPIRFKSQLKTFLYSD